MPLTEDSYQVLVKQGGSEGSPPGLKKCIEDRFDVDLYVLSGDKGSNETPFVKIRGSDSDIRAAKSIITAILAGDDKYGSACVIYTTCVHLYYSW